MDFRSGNKIKIEGGMSSMTDLVFLLLIFFIVISTMITAGVNIDVPKNGGKSSNKKILSININDKNEYFINKNKTAITSEDIESAILKNIGKDSLCQPSRLDTYPPFRSFNLHVSKTLEKLVYVCQASLTHTYRFALSMCTLTKTKKNQRFLLIFEVSRGSNFRPKNDLKMDPKWVPKGSKIGSEIEVRVGTVLGSIF